MSLFNKAVIIGTGLIGGSLAWSIKNKDIASEVWGVSRHKESWQWAKKIKMIDDGSCDIDIAKDAELIVLATPIETIIKLANKLSNIINKECLVTDVGSTKEKIVNKLDKILPNYVGSHPLAGSEKRGIYHAKPDLFKDSICILTPTKNTKQDNLNRIKKLWNIIGAKVVVMSPKMHDIIISFTSHLPHAVAFALINTIPKSYLKFGSTGLKDTTRIASSDNLLWTEIFLSNPKNVISSIDSLEKNLLKIKSAIQKKDRQALARILKQAKQKRENII